MRVAVVGTGISGLVVAHELHRRHEVTVFEAGPWIGGHTNTVEVAGPEGDVAVDTGFIVFNQRTYPMFCALLQSLDVPWKASDMSFSVRCEEGGLEYNGTDLNGLFAQRTNLLRPSFLRMVADILRFYRRAPAILERPDDDTTLGQYLEENRYSRAFIEKHLVPMGAAVWSSNFETMRRFPMRFLVQFFHNHGFLTVEDRPEWLVVEGGSSTYVRRLIQSFQDRIHLRSPVRRVERSAAGVRLFTDRGDAGTFDRVFLATHADTSLSLLADADDAETEVLGAFRFQRNDVLLHTDTSLMPRLKRAWASWNYHVSEHDTGLPTVTYWMNRLQGLTGETQYLVSLNRTQQVAEEHVLRRFTYHHPIFTPRTVLAQRRHAEIDGRGGVHFCGAYWRYGFHEDGVQSAHAALRNLKPDGVLH